MVAMMDRRLRTAEARSRRQTGQFSGPTYWRVRVWTPAATLSPVWTWTLTGCSAREPQWIDATLMHMIMPPGDRLSFFQVYLIENWKRESV